MKIDPFPIKSQIGYRVQGSIGGDKKPSVQRQYIMDRIGQYYNYYGKPRDLKDDEESGIFVRRDKYRVI